MSPQKKRVFRELRKRAPARGVRTGSRADDIKKSFLDNLFCGMGRLARSATLNDLYTALALTVRDRVLKQGGMLATCSKKNAPTALLLSLSKS